MKTTKKQKQKAKALTLEIWAYIKNHPKITEKEELPKRLYRKIENLECECPLCELFFKDRDSDLKCQGCPLGKQDTKNNCFSFSSPFYTWARYDFYSDSERSKSATRLYNIVKRWKI